MDPYKIYYWNFFIEVYLNYNPVINFLLNRCNFQTSITLNSSRFFTFQTFWRHLRSLSFSCNSSFFLKKDRLHFKNNKSNVLCHISPSEKNFFFVIFFKKRGVTLFFKLFCIHLTFYILWILTKCKVIALLRFRIFLKEMSPNSRRTCMYTIN